ncbi:hypothetical protein ATPR_0801 [Acetobacter tropicalis NBRC 101654]|uniref:Uncharacterized protein n=1 Tax=Acetobacter tropicalis NBRC 101654 TaxID=749388 RepID=F7VBQ2_9PROT|nr:hypothetical protein ATPR_0801 [Acetobacter tropicalis NBRC 101654]
MAPPVLPSLTFRHYFVGQAVAKGISFCCAPLLLTDAIVLLLPDVLQKSWNGGIRRKAIVAKVHFLPKRMTLQNILRTSLLKESAR